MRLRSVWMYSKSPLKNVWYERNKFIIKIDDSLESLVLVIVNSRND